MKSNHGASLVHELTLDDWLRPTQELPLECDGLSRVVSVLLDREGIAHTGMIGRLDVVGVGEIPLHYWIALPGGRVIDLRARMWLGQVESVPHGVFMPTARQRYFGYDIDLSYGAEVLLQVQTGLALNAYLPVGGTITDLPTNRN